MALEFEPLGETMAAAVTGVDLARPFGVETTEELIQALMDHQVLCVRNQHLSPRALVVVGSAFGALETFVTRSDRLEEVPEVSVVSNRPPALEGKALVQAKHWHTDGSYLAAPATLTLLQAVTLPETGGDTEFINCCDVLDALPNHLRRRIDGLRAVHKYLSRRNQSWVAKRSEVEIEETPDVHHPLIRTHPLSGRQSLYINPNRIDRILGWGEEESDELLDELYEHAFRPCFQYRHRWQDGDLVIWDNRCTMHRANPDYDLTQLRIMHRVMLEGETPK
ncbi:MAG: Alpha-ketoglutarate-dependent taurine dioxygenase [Alphaproteobacteria bacterium MarineAlpha4_Bin2]|nr:MAG: Alpha-ketoglutarate-dependent taurine dioxygenase [Alphaproteobacteria bacterium MarineAlpha4_Bin2]